MVARRRGSERQLIVHFHIFKNAGSSIDALLQHNFPGRCHSLEADQPWGVLKPEQVAAFHSRHRHHIEVLSSHTARLQSLVLSGVRIHPIVFLRDPIARVHSVYRWHRRQPDSDAREATKRAKQLDFDTYVQWRLEQGCAIRNFQTVFLSGREDDMRSASATEADYIRAVELLRSLPSVGVVERFRASVQQLLAYLEPYYRGLEPLDVHVNASDSPRAGAETTQAPIEALLSAATAELLRHQNHWDLHLYQEALALDQWGESRT